MVVFGSSADVHEKLEDGDGRLRVERRGRLVAEQDFRVQRESARYADALLLAAAQVAHLLVALRGEADELEQLVDPRLGLGLRRPPDLEREHDVLENVLPVHEVEVLENHPHVAAQLLQLHVVQVLDLAALDLHAALGIALEAVEAAQQRRLTRAGMADYAEDVALPDRKGNIRKDLVVAEILPKPSDLDHIKPVLLLRI